MNSDFTYPKGIADGFELPGTLPQYSSSRVFKMTYMSLSVTLDMEQSGNYLVNCEEKIDIETIAEVNCIELDVAEIKVNSVHLCQKRNGNTNMNLHFEENDKNNPDKLVITLPQTEKAHTHICLLINYSAGYDAETGLTAMPRSGFHFISRSPSIGFHQAWTQGEAIESRYWFPCIDDPQVKFPREIHVTVPEDYIAISNGILKEKIEYNSQNVKRIEWVWHETRPISTYLTSLVVGKFRNIVNIYHRNDEDVTLEYYWPIDVEKKYDPMLTFGDTPEVMKFFETYLGILYPYKKYSQVAVEDFDFGGMENASCTTLPDDLFHDLRSLPNYSFDKEVVRHELAHQWFGDLVTCKDWSHIWLNEGFATYFESIYLDREYIEDSQNKNSRTEFYYYVLTQFIDSYLAEARQYKRRIVTNMFKHPDELFDDHSYRKGAAILHMLRNKLGESNFRQSLKQYLTIFANKSVETSDLRKVMEEASGISLERFFDQWVFSPGHPVLNIDILLSKDKLKLTIKQINEKIYEKLTKGDIAVIDPNSIESLTDESEFFEFDLEIKLYFLSSEPKLLKFNVNKNNFEYSVDLNQSEGRNLKFVSIDPELKILKEINYIRFIDELNESENKVSIVNRLIEQLKHGETIIERIDAARQLQKQLPSKAAIKMVGDCIESDPFYGVSIECVNTIVSFVTSETLEADVKSYAFQILESFLSKNVDESAVLDKRILAATLAGFTKQSKLYTKKSLALVERFIANTNWYISRSALAAVGKITSVITLDKNEHVDGEMRFTKEEKLRNIKMLKDVVNKERTDRSFRNFLGRGAISGLQNFADDDDEEIIKDIARFLISCSSHSNDYLIRRDSILSLGQYLWYKIGDEDKKVDIFNKEVFDQLQDVIKSNRFGLQVSACQALVRKLPGKPDSGLIKTLEILIFIAEHDTDGSVRREAQVSINQIRKRMSEWLEKPIQLEDKIRQDRDKLHEKIMDVRRRRLSFY